MILGILLAAGHGRRIGGPKALLRLNGQTFYERGLGAFREAGLTSLAVVNEAVDKALGPGGEGEVRALNDDPEGAAGMFGSVRLGLAAAIEAGATGVILLPVDLPLVTGRDIGAVAKALVGGAAIVVATHNGRRGHPIGIGRKIMEEVLASSTSATMRDIVHRDSGRVTEIPASEGTILGVNTKEDLEEVSKRTFR